MEEVIVCKIPLEQSSEDFITIYSEWHYHKFSVKVIHKKSAWERNVSSDCIKSLTGFAQCGVEEYIKETKRALTTQGGAKDFTYSLIDSEFTWKKIIDNFRVKYGIIRLEMASVGCIADLIIDFLLKRGNLRTSENIFLKEENDNLKMGNSNLITQMDEIASLKTAMEEKLYKKFRLLLNAKKEKILELERIINEQRCTTSGTNCIMNQDITKISEESLPSEKVHDPYGSETEIDSDEEKRLPVQPVKEDTGSETGLDTDEEKYQPSTSKIQKLGSPKEHNVIDISDDSNSQPDLKNDWNDSFDKNLSVPVRAKKTQKTKFNKSTYKENNGASTSFSPSKSQNVPCTSDDTEKQFDKKTKLAETKSSTSEEQNIDKYNLGDLLSEM